MFIIINYDNIVQAISPTLEEQKINGELWNYVVNNGEYAVPLSGTKQVFQLNNIPEEVKPFEYFYSPELGFSPIKTDIEGELTNG